MTWTEQQRDRGIQLAMRLIAQHNRIALGGEMPVYVKLQREGRSRVIAVTTGGGTRHVHR